MRTFARIQEQINENPRRSQGISLVQEFSQTQMIKSTGFEPVSSAVPV